MGLIKAGLGAVGGVPADQQKEFFCCEAMDKEVMVTKGHKDQAPAVTNSYILLRRNTRRRQANSDQAVK